jgi:hypothetical protein
MHRRTTSPPLVDLHTLTVRRLQCPATPHLLVARLITSLDIIPL